MTDISTGAHLLASGHLVAFPTETVYGLGANALDIEAVQQIFLTKGRPQDNPLIVHLADPEDIPSIAMIRSPLEQDLIDRWMPGPLTLLLHTTVIPSLVTAGHDRVGVRIPDHEVARRLIREAGVPVCAPSANISGKPSPTTADMVRSYFGEKMPVIDGGSCQVGIESTVVGVVNDEVVIYRPGMITAEMLAQTWQGRIPVRIATADTGVSPGTRYRHYAPQCQICLIPGDRSRFESELLTRRSQHKKIGLLVMDGYLSHHGWLRHYIALDAILSRGQTYEDAAQRLYVSYQHADRLGLDILYIQVLDEVGIGAAIMNRVRKSAE